MYDRRRRAAGSLIALAVWCGCGGGSAHSARAAFILNKSSGQIDTCSLGADDLVDFASCRSASSSQFAQPIDLVINGTAVFMSVESGIEKCILRNDQLTSCTLAISDSGFPVGLTLFNGVLFVADYSAKMVNSYNVTNLEMIDGRALDTAPTEVVFYGTFAYVVTQDIAGSIVLRCDTSLENCSSVYAPLDSALLAMAIDNSVAFLTNASDNNVSACEVNDDGTFSGCTIVGDASVFNYPYGITIDNDTAYIPNRAEASITVCSVNDKTLIDCAKVTNSLFDGPTWVVLEPQATP